MQHMIIIDKANLEAAKSGFCQREDNVWRSYCIFLANDKKGWDREWLPGWLKLFKVESWCHQDETLDFFRARETVAGGHQSAVT